MAETTVTGPDLVDDGIPLDSLGLNEPVKGQFEGKQVIVVRTETRTLRRRRALHPLRRSSR